MTLRTRWLAPVAFTLILVGYLQVWLPNRSVGLALLGIELGEWLKFLPDVHYGNAPINRNLFYLPPISLGWSMVLLSLSWPNRWQTWLFRLLAVSVSLLALPSIVALVEAPPTEWGLRVGWFVSVAIAAVLAPWLTRLPQRFLQGLLLLFGLLGLIVPTYAFLVMRPILASFISGSVGIGIGVWLNLIGHLAVIILALTPHNRTK